MPTRLERRYELSSNKAACTRNNYFHVIRIRQESPTLGIVPETLWNDDWHRSYDCIWPEQQARFNC